MNDSIKPMTLLGELIYLCDECRHPLWLVLEEETNEYYAECLFCEVSWLT